MDAFIFTDKALERHAGRFVWLKMEMEKPQHARFHDWFNVESYPTMLVIDSASEEIAVKYQGSTTLPQLEALLARGEQAVSRDAGGPDLALIEADALVAADKPFQAAHLLRGLLERMPRSWPKRSRAVETLSLALGSSQQNEALIELARRELPHLPKDGAYVTIAVDALFAALVTHEGAPWRRDAILELERLVKEGVRIPPQEITVWARGNLYESWFWARDSQNDVNGRLFVAKEWASFLEREAKAARSALGRSVFNSDRVVAYRALGHIGRAVPVLEDSERKLPNLSNPTSNLVEVYLALERYDDAIDACRRALPKDSGSHRLYTYQTCSLVYVRRANERERKHLDPVGAREDREQAYRLMEEGLRFAASLPRSRQKLRDHGAARRAMSEVLKGLFQGVEAEVANVYRGNAELGRSPGAVRDPVLQFSRQQRLETCGGDLVRTVYTDREGRVRKYVAHLARSEGQEWAVTRTHHYDELERLRYVLTSGIGVHGSAFTDAYFFDREEKVLWEEHQEHGRSAIGLEDLRAATAPGPPPRQLTTAVDCARAPGVGASGGDEPMEQMQAKRTRVPAEAEAAPGQAVTSAKLEPAGQVKKSRATRAKRKATAKRSPPQR